MNSRPFLPILASLVVIAACGCVGNESAAKSDPAPAPEPAAEPAKMIDVASGNYEPLKPPKEGEEVVVLETAAGKIVLRFFEDAAPKHVKSFKDLVRKGFYDGTRFHRVIPGFVIQGGDPNTVAGDPATWGQGGPPNSVDAEFSPIPHKRGILSMARSSDPNSAGSQFFVVHQDSNSLDEQYTVFGAVVEGMEAVDRIVNTPTTDANGTVVPAEAVKLSRAKLATWPLK